MNIPRQDPPVETKSNDKSVETYNPMKDTLKTFLFVAAALVMFGFAGLAYNRSKPIKIDDFELVGKPFFENFDDAKEAQSLEVTALNPNTATVDQFKVEEDKGLWRIPSHHNYPAEAAERLATTATSVIGLQREALIGRTKGDHERFGVVDPLDENIRDPETAGKRITIIDGAGDTMVDLIVGKKAGDVDTEPVNALSSSTSQENFYYVRRPEENQTFKVKLDIDLSTRFSDWIRPDLLQIELGELREIFIDNYEMKQERTSPLSAPQLLKMQGEKIALKRNGDVGPWEMTELDETTEKLDNSKVDQLVTDLDALRIVGVRPKTLYDGLQILTPSLKLNKEVVAKFKDNTQQLQSLINKVQFELQEYGFNLAPAPGGTKNDLMLVSENGEMSIGTDKGVVYSLQFGKPVIGEDQIIEIGAAKQDDTKSEGTDQKPVVTQTETYDSEVTKNEERQTVKNRFLMIRVNFDESLIAGKPVKPQPPTAPVKPEGYQAAVNDASNDAAPSPNAKEGEQDANNSDKQTPALEDRDPTFKAYDIELKNYEQASAIYELGLTRFEDEQIEYNKKIKSGQKRTAALNERYGPWFYVISGENLEALQIDRKQLLQPAPAQPDGPQGGPALPQRPDIKFAPPIQKAKETPDVAQPPTPAKPPAASEPEPKNPKSTEKTDKSSGDNNSGGLPKDY